MRREIARRKKRALIISSVEPNIFPLIFKSTKWSISTRNHNDRRNVGFRVEPRAKLDLNFSRGPNNCSIRPLTLREIRGRESRNQISDRIYRFVTGANSLRVSTYRFPFVCVYNDEIGNWLWQKIRIENSFVIWRKNVRISQLIRTI